MAPVWTMVSPKGGAGKTTLALVLAGELAKYGKRVTLIDADPNQPLVRWVSHDNGPETVSVIADEDANGRTILDNIEKAKALSDYVIVDTEGTDNNRATIATQLSDFILIPIQSSEMDLVEGAKAIHFVDYTGRVQGRHIPRLIIRTLIEPAIKDRVEKEVEAQLACSDQPVCSVHLIRRAAYKSLMLLGCTIHTFEEFEAANLSKAKDNAELLLNAVAVEYRNQINAITAEKAKAS